MPGKTSYYSRLQAMLDLAGNRVPSSSDDFVHGIIRKSPPNFVYYRWNEEKEENVAHCSEVAVKRTFELAVDLGFLSPESGRLTDSGKEAADPARYDVALRRAVRSFLQRCGCPVKNLEAASREMLRKSSIVLPNANELFSATSNADGFDLTEPKFHSLLQLLAASGGIRLSRAHIFLPTAG
jgi:hypothetical protein